jgi:signal transduction histidine kinase/CheY-like chemotaxis protein
MDEIRSIVANMEAGENRLLAERDARAKRTAGNTFYTILFGTSAGFALVLLTAFILTKSIVRPLRKLVDGAEQIGSGKLEHRVDVKAKDEIGELAQAFNRMTEKVQDREVLISQSNAELQRASQLKSEFLASMSHELRTPLNAILGFSELLLHEAPFAQEGKYKRWITHIEQGGKHLLQLVNDILDLSKIEAGHVELKIESFAIDSAIPEVISNIRYLAMVKKIKLEVQSSTGIAIAADRIRFKQILYNLLSNAIKFTPANGRIDLNVTQDSDRVSISVIDTGVGIRLEDQAVVFDQFRQVGKTARGVTEGTGLGLAITKNLVERQGGEIWVESKLGEGSRFTFTLPIGLVPAEQVPVVALSRETHSSRTQPLVLVVDDEATAQELLVATLREEGYDTETANSGEEALVKALKLLPDAITLDMLMPGQSGWDTLFHLKTTPATAAIPVLVVSIVDNKTKGFALGAAEYLIKPIKKDALLAGLQKHLGTSVSPRVLVVDDEISCLQVATEILDSSGYLALTAHNGKEALQQLSAHKVDAILLDLLMPEMDGFELLRALAENEAMRRIPVFVVTSKELSSPEKEFLHRATQGIFLKATDSWKGQVIAQLQKATSKAAARAVGQSDSIV